MRTSGLLLLFSCVLAAATHEIYPDRHSRVFSARVEPVLRIHSGETVITKTWDSGGQDYKGVRHLQQPYVYPETGNPLMGPFYIEEADRGDALEVHLDRVRLNRNWGYTAYRLSPDILTSGAAEAQYKNFYKMDAVRPGSATLIPWDLDLTRKVANPRLLESSGYKFDLPVKPMLGCIGVATPGDEVLTSGPADSHGGNMDYNDIGEGATLFFPVYHKGAYFYLGDGHALQGDGEGLGTGIETSLDVQFTVTVHKGKNLSMPRLINDEYLISIGSQPEFHSNTDYAIRISNADMLRWLTADYKLSAPEANLLMGMVVQHKIVTYFGTVATLIPRKYVDKK
ncbi:MAG: acetamidase/formamidase family protein [Acidobacteriota bacterium]|nr:acetamidase/formamidase family protein [Acidobacteriota bacterium]